MYHMKTTPAAMDGDRIELVTHVCKLGNDILGLIVVLEAMSSPPFGNVILYRLRVLQSSMRVFTLGSEKQWLHGSLYSLRFHIISGI